MQLAPGSLPRDSRSDAPVEVGSRQQEWTCPDLCRFYQAGVKSGLAGGSAPYVVKATITTAVLVELFFLDSAADRAIFGKTSPKEIAAGIFEALSPVHPLTVEEAIVKFPGSTSAAKGLSDQIIKETGLGTLELVVAPNFKAASTCEAYFQPAAAASLRQILRANPYLLLECSSAYRSPVRQAMLWEWSQSGRGGITLAARVGSSDHEHGLALDIANYLLWKEIFIKAGWRWQGGNDPVHFYFSKGDRDFPSKAIAAFQTLHNRSGSGDRLEVDGDYGARTRLAMLAAPAGGW